MQELQLNTDYCKTKRLSMAELQSQARGYFGSTRRTSRHNRNSSIEGKSEERSARQPQSAKSCTLAFNKLKSRQSMFESSCKENKEPKRRITEEENCLKFSNARPPRKRNCKGKSTVCEANAQEAELSLGALERELGRIMEHAVTSQRGGCSLDQFDLVQKLGEGAYSSVFLAFEKQTRTAYALKVIKREVLEQQGNFQRLLSQIKIQSFSSHRNIAKLYCVFSDQSAVYLLQEYAGRQTLYSLMTLQGPCRKIHREAVVSYVSQLCAAIGYLHANCVIHRDIKPENILVAPGGVVKLIDFGWSVHNPRKQLRKTFCGTPIYFSPELLSAQYYDESVDIWAIGVLTYELLTGSNPFNISCFQQLGKIISQQVDLGRIADSKARDFVSELLTKERVLRKSMEDLCQHPFLNTGNKLVQFK